VKKECHRIAYDFNGRRTLSKSHGFLSSQKCDSNYNQGNDPEDMRFAEASVLKDSKASKAYNNGGDDVNFADHVVP